MVAGSVLMGTLFVVFNIFFTVYQIFLEKMKKRKLEKENTNIFLDT